MVAERGRLMMDDRHYHLYVCLCIVTGTLLSLPRVTVKFIVVEPRWFIVTERRTLVVTQRERLMKVGAERTVVNVSRVERRCGLARQGCFLV